MSIREDTGPLSECNGTRDSLVACSRKMVIPPRLLKLGWYLRTDGLIGTALVVMPKIRYLIRGSRGRRASNDRRTTECHSAEALQLRPGEWVQVKLETLDEDGRNMGLMWMPSMSRFCGRRLRVFKRVERIVLEGTGQIRDLRNTVLLEGAICQGKYGCDRSCFHFWREVWLERVSGENAKEAVCP
jgi:hypothetical protein